MTRLNGKPKTLPARLLLIGLLLFAPAGCGTLGGPASIQKKTPGPEKGSFKKSVVLEGPRAEYGLEVGGKVDMDNSLTHRHTHKEIFYQNNISLTIANVGRSTVVNPRVLINGRGVWRDADQILKEALEGARTEQDRIYLILRHMARNTHHDNPCFEFDYHDPVVMYNVYGGGFCDDLGHVAAELCRRAGFNKENLGRNPLLRLLGGHVMCEIPVREGGYQFIDADQAAFYLDRENKRPVSGSALAEDHDLAKRELCRGMYPAVSEGWAYTPESWNYSQENAALFGPDDRLIELPKGSPLHRSPKRMDYRLRPGERIVFRWDNVGKMPSNPARFLAGLNSMHYFGNSKIIFRPDLTAEGALGPFARLEGLEHGPDGLEITNDKATLIFWTETPYVIAGASLWADIKVPDKEAGITVEVSRNGLFLEKPWSGVGSLPGDEKINLDRYLALNGRRPARKYQVVITVNGGRGGLVSGLRLETDLVASPMSLPRLRAGRNKVVYEDDTKGPGRVEITHCWREFPGVKPPPAPRGPVKPAPGGLVRETFVDFEWAGVRGAEIYQITVSPREDLLYPFRPSLEVYLEDNAYRVPRRGIFNPGRTYYWRVRARQGGVWGPWSRVRSFSWEGPLVPRRVRLEEAGEGMVLRWEPNPSGGTRPVRYHVFADDEAGFSVSREPHTVLGRGRVPGNYLGVTDKEELLVVSPREDRPNMNRAFYRVVAEDASGVESCPSRAAALPTPHIVTRSLPRAEVGRPYGFRIKTVRSLGDLQFHKGKFAFSREEKVAYKLVEGPAWLSIDRNEGLLRGRPGPPDLGRHEVVVEVSKPPAPKRPRKRNEVVLEQKPRQRLTARQGYVLEVIR